MSRRATATFKIEEWDEKPYAEMEDGRKLVQASVRQAFSGEIEGQSEVQWLMCYRPDLTADFVGLERIVGRIGDRSGSFAALHSAGSFDGTVARAKLSVVPGSGTGELEGLRGAGEFTAPHGGEPSLTLDYELD
jgi:Protein of unknown function (DUF3224)